MKFISNDAESDVEVGTPGDNEFESQLMVGRLKSPSRQIS